MKKYRNIIIYLVKSEKFVVIGNTEWNPIGDTIDEYLEQYYNEIFCVFYLEEQDKSNII